MLVFPVRTNLSTTATRTSRIEVFRCRPAKNSIYRMRYTSHAIFLVLLELHSILNVLIDHKQKTTSVLYGTRVPYNTLVDDRN